MRNFVYDYLFKKHSIHERAEIEYNPSKNEASQNKVQLLYRDGKPLTARQRNYLELEQMKNLRRTEFNKAWDAHVARLRGEPDPARLAYPMGRHKIPVQYWEEITPSMVIGIDSYSAMSKRFTNVPIVNDGNRRFFIHTI